MYIWSKLVHEQYSFASLVNSSAHAWTHLSCAHRWFCFQRSNYYTVDLFFLSYITIYTCLYIPSWIYDYLCNQCLSPLTLWVRIRSNEVYSIQHYVIEFVSDLRQVGGFLRVLRFSSTNKTDLYDRYNWNIVESGVKYHNPNLYIYRCLLIT